MPLWPKVEWLQVQQEVLRKTCYFVMRDDVKPILGSIKNVKQKVGRGLHSNPAP